MKYLIIIAFIVTVKVPWGLKQVYKNVESFDLHPSGFVFTLVLSDKRTVYVPSQWTIVEEK